MKQKIIQSSLLRCVLLFFCVVFSFVAFVACSDKSNGESATNTIADIYAADVNVEYDGRPHSIAVNNTHSSDTILYSTDGKNFSESSPIFIFPDTYTVFYKVMRSGYADFSSSATVTITPSILDGITATNTTVFYDGQSHSVSINGTLVTDKVTYSTDGISFSADKPSFSEVGAHTIYYCVERIYGDYKSSCTLTIIPDIFGRYFNPSFGLIVIAPDYANVNSVKKNVTIDLDGSGYIDNSPFSVSDNCLIYNSLSFTALSDEKYVYKLSSPDTSVYFCYADKGVFHINFKDNKGNIKLDEQTLVSVPDVNYCDSAIITDYAELKFEQEFTHSSDLTEINVSFSQREKNPFLPQDIYYTYDGLPHGFDFSDTVVFSDDTEPAFTEIGKHTVSALFLSDKYLPLFADCTLIIMPNIDGVYFSSDRILKFDDETVYIDGEYAGELSTLDEDWTYDGLPITVTNNGIAYNGEDYTTTEQVMIVDIDNTLTSRIIIPPESEQIDILFDKSALVFAQNTDIILTVPLNSETLYVVCNGKRIEPVQSDSSNYFILGTSELDIDIVLVNVSTK